MRVLKLASLLCVLGSVFCLNGYTAAPVRSAGIAGGVASSPVPSGGTRPVQDRTRHFLPNQPGGRDQTGKAYYELNINPVQSDVWYGNAQNTRIRGPNNSIVIQERTIYDETGNSITSVTLMGADGQTQEVYVVTDGTTGESYTVANGQYYPNAPGFFPTME